jgi:hypothetical protein
VDHDRLQLRTAALEAASRIAAGDCQPMQVKVQQVVHATEQFYQLLTAEGPPVRLVLRSGMVYRIVNGRRVFDGWPIRKGTAMQLKDNQQVDLTVEAVDAKGFDVADTITWTASDTTAVSLVPAPDGKTVTVVANSPAVGVVLTATDGAGLTVTDTVDVITGDAVALKITEGTPVDQPPAAPAPAPGA